MRPPLLPLLAALLLAAGPAAADDGTDFAAAAAAVHRAQAGDSATTDEAVRRFEALSAAAPDSPLLAAYLGAAQVLQGRDALMPWTKTRATEKGLATLERALRRLEARHEAELIRGAPLALETRLVAASTYLAVPGFFNRLDAGKAVLREAFQSPALAGAPAEIKARLYQQAAVAAGRDGKPQLEVEELKKALAADPAGPVAAAVKRRLRALES